MQHQHIISIIILTALFVVVCAVGIFIGCQFENKNNYDMGFSAGWDKAVNEFTQNNLIPQSPGGLTTVAGTVVEKNLHKIKVELAPNIFMPIIDPNKKIREIKITDETIFCKYLKISPDEIIAKIKDNQLENLSQSEPIKFSEIKVGAGVLLYLQDNIQTTVAPTAEQICLQ